MPQSQIGRLLQNWCPCPVVMGANPSKVDAIQRRQLLRCGLAASPNYAEARAAESRADFIHKLRIVLKELNETKSWLEQIVAAK